jgi:GTPase SAR1 family protein
VVEGYYKDADAIILVADINNKLSLQEIDEYWLYEVRRHIKKECQVYLFVNKSDDPRARLQREEVAWCDSQNLRYYMVSARTGRDVHDAVNDIAKILKQIKPREENSKIVMSLN